MISLSVNLNKIALLRNSREGNYPDLLSHAKTCIAAGAHGITVHPRPDQRHIRPSDVFELATLLEDMDGLEFNIEGNPFARAQGSYPGLLALVEETRPDQCTLVPDSNDQLTSDHGFDLTSSADTLEPVIEKLHTWGVRVSLFMDPDPKQLTLARDLKADRVELYTGPYAQDWPDSSRRLGSFQRYRNAAVHASEIGLGLNAGHDLNLDNLPLFATLPGLLEVSIGHALIVDALAIGLESSVRAYRHILEAHAAGTDIGDKDSQSEQRRP
ncbi:MAG TPA: pyridoxine 5'-phosphate synthase [Porticoccaceae bacterium]|nr:pyridoxine 5'-phosphate synthase [Porticoccaceae bacterium]